MKKIVTRGIISFISFIGISTAMCLLYALLDIAAWHTLSYLGEVDMTTINWQETAYSNATMHHAILFLAIIACYAVCSKLFRMECNHMRWRYKKMRRSTKALIAFAIIFVSFSVTTLTSTAAGAAALAAMLNASVDWIAIGESLVGISIVGAIFGMIISVIVYFDKETAK